MWIACVATKGIDGSPWRPMVLQSQVRCGSVYVTSEDSTQKVTQTVVTATSVAEKKRRANKYTVAVGTSHGHVQAFLEDADSVLAALDQCPAEEKCLMLIKRPKESAKKMLKSHSWANLSVSDPQLYRQFNGVQLSQVHHPAPIYKGRRSSDEQSVTSNDTDRSEPRRRYVNARGNKENLKHQQQHQQQQPQQPHRGPHDNHNKSLDYYHSDSSSVNSDYQYVPRRDRDRDHSRRSDLRYSSIPEDAQEINNNSDKGNNPSIYHSCHDVSFASQASSTNRSDWSRKGQGQPGQDQPGQGRPGQVQGQLTSDRMYGSPVKAVHDPGDMEEGARSQSLGNLSTGLTLSLVGQRKADSMLDLTGTPSSAPSSSQQHHQQPPPRTHAPRPRRSEGGNYPQNVRSPEKSVQSPRHSYPDAVRPDKSVQSPRHSYPDAVRSPGASGRDEVFSPPRDTNGYYNGVQSPPHYQKYPQNYQPNYAPGSQRGSHHGQSIGYAYGNSSSGSSTSREQTPQSDAGPPAKPKRNLPYVPPNESSERIKRFTEMMKSRMSVCSSSAGRSTANSIGSQTSTTPQTPVSRQASVNENTSDSEISTLLEVRMLDGGYSSPQKHPSEGGGGGGGGPGRPPQHPQDPRVKEDEGRGKNHLHVYPSRHMPSSQDTTPQSYGTDPMSESTQSRFTSHSHSSTMDSGYTTNTEGDADSTNASHQLSPPHPNHQHPPHPHPHPNHQHPPHPHPHPHPNPPPNSQPGQFSGSHTNLRPSNSHPNYPSNSLPNHPSNSHPNQQSNSHPNHPSNSHPNHPSNSHPNHPSNSHPNHPSNSHPNLHPSNSHPQHPSNSNHPSNFHQNQPSNSHASPPHPSSSHHLHSQPNHSGQHQHPSNVSHFPPPPPQYQNHHPHHPPPQTAGAELVRPVPVPRNLTLANSRKFSSMQNVSSVHGQHLSYPSGPPPPPPPPPQPNPGDWNEGKGPQNAPSHPKGPIPVRAQHSMNSVDYPLVTEHPQRRSWDLSNHFKSLDFTPVAESGGGKAVGGAQPRDDHVVKPQAVSVNCVVRQVAESGSPRRTHPQQRRDSQENGQSKRSSWHELRNQDKPPLPLSQPPPPPPLLSADANNGTTTLPGHWKYNNTNNVNAVNNNTTTATTNTTHNGPATSTPNSSNASSPKSPPKPTIDTSSPPAVSLFQLSQCYDMCSVKLSLPGNLNANTLLSLGTVQVTLPALNLENCSPPVHSPQGRCARLGGPGSAFRPVKTGAGGGQMTVAVAAVGSVDKQCKQLCTLGEIHAGDLLVEVNGRQCLDWDLASVQRLLDSSQGEIMLGTARVKKDQIDNRVQQLETSLHKMEMEVKRLNEELSKKDYRIRELSTMLPWKADEDSSGGKVILESEEGVFVIGDNEFVV
ncbi:hornerin-like isoform X2 [Littorina saxatilis]|uniref:hornerin-like isoform X2 n=1 Tax=Littorina saxatilis TaxID=31220 RepID=UPI0038B60723